MSGNGLHLNIILPDTIIFSGEIQKLMFKSDGGDVTVMRGHEACVVEIKSGELFIVKDGEKLSYTSKGGLLQFDDNRADLLSEFAWLTSQYAQKEEE